MAAGMTVFTVTTQVMFIMGAVSFMKRKAAERDALGRPARSGLFLAGVTLWMLLAFTMIATIWAILLVMIGALSSFETALYFSMVTFTTLGFGDIVLDQQWHVLSAMIAANGLLVFGLNTAVIVETLRGVMK